MNEIGDAFFYMTVLCLRGVAVLAVVLLSAWLIPKFIRLAYDLAQKEELHKVKLQAAAVELAQRKAEVERYMLDSAIVIARPDRISIPREMLGEAFTGQLQLALAQIDAQRTHAPVPHSISYAPHVAHRNDIQGVSNPDLAQLAAPVPPDFWQLFNDHKLPNNGFLLGYNLDDGQPVTADWRKLYSALIGGQSGSGKSTLVRNVCAQAAMQGGKFVILDPHADAGDESLAHSLRPLQRLMLCAPASSDDDMRASLHFVESTVKARLSGKDTDRTPLILIVDELTGLLARGAVADDLLDVLALVSQESRKVAIYALGLGQQFQASLFPSEVRNSFVSFISCRARRDTARVMSGNNEFGKLAEGLTVGQCVWMSPAGDVVRVNVPNTTERHLELVGRQMDTGRYDATPTGGSDGVRVASVSRPHGLIVASADDEPDTDRTPQIEPTDAKAAHVRTLLAQGVDHPTIIENIWGVNSSAGRPYRRARAEFESIVNSLAVAA